MSLHVYFMWLDILRPSIQIDILTIILNEYDYCLSSKDYQNGTLYFLFGYKHLHIIDHLC